MFDIPEIQLPNGLRGVKMNGALSKKKKTGTKKAAGKAFRARLSSQNIVRR